MLWKITDNVNAEGHEVSWAGGAARPARGQSGRGEEPLDRGRGRGRRSGKQAPTARPSTGRVRFSGHPLCVSPGSPPDPGLSLISRSGPGCGLSVDLPPQLAGRFHATKADPSSVSRENAGSSSSRSFAHKNPSSRGVPEGAACRQHLAGVSPGRLVTCPLPPRGDKKMLKFGFPERWGLGGGRAGSRTEVAPALGVSITCPVSY